MHDDAFLVVGAGAGCTSAVTGAACSFGTASVGNANFGSDNVGRLRRRVAHIGRANGERDRTEVRRAERDEADT